jgi:hypothetical protein
MPPIVPCETRERSAQCADQQRHDGDADAPGNEAATQRPSCITGSRRPGPRVQKVVNDERAIRLPPGTGIAVFLTVVVLIALVLIAQRVPHALRPTIQPPPVTTVITVTNTPTPSTP